jgi:hypothetical protein
MYDNRGAGYGEEYRNSIVRFYNGHPALELDKLLGLKSREVRLKASLSQATVIGAFAPYAGFDANMLLYGLHGRPGEGVFVGTDKVYSSLESGKAAFDYGETEGMDLRYTPSDSEPDAETFRSTSLRITSWYRTLPPSTSLWGERESSVLTFNSTPLQGNVNHNSTYNIPLSENRQFTGYIPEIIVYNRLLTPQERRRVESYLAIKYGLSLPVSYLGSDGRLLWDSDSQPEYNHRISALYRDDTSGLVQTESASSYEETPYYSDQSAHDYYYQGNPNNRSSESRLLVAGLEPGNLLHEGEYLFRGDNGADVALNSTPWREGLKRMDRRWLVKSGLRPVSGNEPLLWETENLEFNLDSTGYAISVIKAGGNAAERGTAVTALPLTGESGYLGVSNYVATGGLTLRFGAQTANYSAGSHDYGYFIGANSYAYKIEGGVRGVTPAAFFFYPSTIEVEKSNDKLYLRVNGSRLPESEITILPADRSRSFYGAIAVERGLSDAGFNLRHGGFNNTGQRVELSYGIASDFTTSGEEQAVLVVDRSGWGEFQPSDVEYIPVSEVDIVRKKLIFHNVFFDSDGSGSDVFTFAYGKRDGRDLLEIIPPTCGESNGSFRLEIDWGARGYNYELKDLATGNSVDAGWEDSRFIRSTGLATGDYELTVSEAGGYNFETAAAPGVLHRAKTTNYLPVFDGYITWRVSNLSGSYTIGYTASIGNAGSMGTVFHYGLKQSGSQLYKVENEIETAVNGVTLQAGDELKIVKGYGYISYYHNGSQVETSAIRFQEYGLPLYALMDFGDGPTEVLNVGTEEFYVPIDYRWDTTEGVTAVRSSGVTKKYSIHIPSCTTVEAGALSPEMEASSGDENRLRVSVIPGTQTLHVELRLASPCNVSLAVYDLRGIPVAQKELSGGQSVQTAEISLPQAGAYIVKALTEEGGEYGKKIIIR